MSLKQVGEFPEQPSVVRSIRNPMDKSTIVSIFPKEILEQKYTIEPGRFHIPAGSFENPSLLVVGSSSWWREMENSMPMLEIPVSSVAVANSIINDYCNGMLGCNMNDARPGLFFILGEVDIKEVKLKYLPDLKRAKLYQDNWFKILVRLADSLWARANGNPLVISDEMRMAARHLNFNDKPWLKDFNITEMTKCVACGSLKNPEFPVCPSCHAIDKSHPGAKDLEFAS